MLDEPPLNDATSKALEPNAFQKFYNDQNKVASNLKLACIILMKADRENNTLLEEKNKDGAHAPPMQAHTIHS